MNNTFLVLNDSTDTHGRPIQWIPYGRMWTITDTQTPTGPPQLYARHAVPVTVERYEVGYGVLPLPTTATSTSTATTAGTTTPISPADQEILKNCGPDDIPPHLAPYFTPKLIRDGTSVRLGQVRFDETTQRFCWQVFAQPLRMPTERTVHPQLRISCPSVDKKFDMEAIIHFTRHYNIRSNGSYYKATPERVCDGRGYGTHGAIAPTTSGEFPIFRFNSFC